jgi:hypothetical protein
MQAVYFEHFGVLPEVVEPSPSAAGVVVKVEANGHWPAHSNSTRARLFNVYCVETSPGGPRHCDRSGAHYTRSSWSGRDGSRSRGAGPTNEKWVGRNPLVTVSSTVRPTKPTLIKASFRANIIARAHSRKGARASSTDLGSPGLLSGERDKVRTIR